MFTYQSQYAYAANNPVRYIDVLGMYAGEAGKWDSGDSDFGAVLAYYGIGSNSNSQNDENEDDNSNKQEEAIDKNPRPSRLTGGVVSDEEYYDYMVNHAKKTPKEVVIYRLRKKNNPSNDVLFVLLWFANKINTAHAPIHSLKEFFKDYEVVECSHTPRIRPCFKERQSLE
jgi:hypothetical protein